MFRKANFTAFAALILVATAPQSAALANTGEKQTVISTESGGGQSNAKAERKICKTIADSARRTNNKRLCMTQAQWEKFDEAMED